MRLRRGVGVLRTYALWWPAWRFRPSRSYLRTEPRPTFAHRTAPDTGLVAADGVEPPGAGPPEPHAADPANSAVAASEASKDFPGIAFSVPFTDRHFSEDEKRADSYGLDNGFPWGAGEGNRTLMTSLEGWGSAIELRPRTRLEGIPPTGAPPEYR